MRWIPFIFLVVVSSNVLCQNTGEIFFKIRPSYSFEFILDDNKRMKQKKVELSEGVHNFKLWAPSRSIVDTNITVIADSTSIFTLELPFDPDHVVFVEELRVFNKKRMWYLVPSAAAFAGTAWWMATAYGEYEDAYNELNAQYDRYQSVTDPDEFPAYRDILQDRKDEFKQKEDEFIVSAVVFGATAIASVFMVTKALKLEKPVFHDKAKLEFDGLVYVPREKGEFYANIRLRF